MKRAIPYFVILIFSLLLFGSVLFPSKGEMIRGEDHYEWEYYPKKYFFENLKKGYFPLWNPYLFSGVPFFPPETVYPPNFLYIALPFSLGLSLYYFFHVNLAGIFMYRFLKKKVDRLSALGGALAFGFGGGIFVRIFAGHPNYVAGITIIPFIFGSYQDYLQKKGKKDFVKTVMGIALQFLVDIPHFIFSITLLLMLFYTFYHLLKHFNKRRRFLLFSLKEMLAFFLITAFSFLLIAFYSFPFTELVFFNSSRQGGLSYEAAAKGSITFESLLLFIDPYRLGSPLPEDNNYRGPLPNYAEVSVFCGRTTVLLILVFAGKEIYFIIRRKKTDRFFLFLLLAALFFLIAALGDRTPFYRIWYEFFPPARFHRIPSRNLMMVVFLLPVLFALSISKIKPTSLKILMISLLAVELFFFDKTLIMTQPTPDTLIDSETVNFLKKNTGNERVLPNYHFQSIQGFFYNVNSPLETGLASTGGVAPIIMGRYREFLETVNQVGTADLSVMVEVPLMKPNSPALDFLNVKYIISDLPLAGSDGTGGKFKLVTRKKYFQVYENTEFQDRYFIVPEAEYFKNDGELRKVLASAKADFRRKVYLIGSPKDDFREVIKCEGSAPEVKIVSYKPEEVRMTATNDCPGFLVGSDTYYPYWKVTVDGKEKPVLTANYAFRAVELEKGRHEIVFYYYPYMIYIGIVVSILTGLGLTVYMVKKDKAQQN